MSDESDLWLRYAEENLRSAEVLLESDDCGLTTVNRERSELNR